MATAEMPLSPTPDPYDHGIDEDAPLPFPSTLPRDDFLQPDFDPVAYLSALPHRHQTLEDLRGELRDRSAAISAELLELVNSNYTSFLSLGAELQGGEDRVEDAKVALLAFRRQIDDVGDRVRSRASEVAGLTAELGAVRREIETARKMLDLSQRISGLEQRLALASIDHGNKTGAVADWSGDEDSGSDGDGDGGAGSSISKIASLTRDYQHIVGLADELGRDVAFVAKMEERMVRCRSTILLDLGTALKKARAAGDAEGRRVLRCLAMYRALQAPSDAVKVLRDR